MIRTLVVMCLCACGDQFGEVGQKPPPPPDVETAPSCTITYRLEDLNQRFKTCLRWGSADFFNIGDTTPHKYWWCSEWVTP